MGNHLYDQIRSSMPAPGRTFASLHDGRRYTYQDVEEASARFANALVELGVTPGDRVAVQAEKSIEALMLYLGTVRAGAVFLPYIAVVAANGGSAPDPARNDFEYHPDLPMIERGPRDV